MQVSAEEGERIEVLRCYIATLLKEVEEIIEVGGDRKLC